ncbi:Gfo/Idh/MocA family protein [Pseudonocardia sp. KRD291]|uniref:Gfo/Idh/MocA family protein n=1 Tax=Pseudonocardia sp. KRD291 TaxID=2792007 RepID=UPI001C4A3657|nr:Gfo/Idh/MocA family oxidoreductase [Pseudonocardia sp. KRD291]MBW0106258.1 Gfo/Idh/MocA family oxidoreductase [Pseudonocardia sp. KRD291]
MSEGRRRIGLVGAGPWARAVHAPAIAAHPRWELAGAWTRRPEAAREIVDGFGGRAFTRLEDLVDACDAVAFAVPPAVQGELAPRVAAAGRHVVLEKPLAQDLAGARAVADAVSAAGVCSATMLTLRFDPGVRAWLDAIPDGPAGPDTTGSARWLSGGLLGGPYSRSAWRAEHGALLDIGPHVIDLLDAALGPVVGVDTAHRAEPDLWRFGLAHAGGAHSSVTLSLRLPVDPTEFEATVFGAAGRHRLDRRPTDAAACYGCLLDDLASAVAQGRTDLSVGVARALHLQEVIEQVLRAAG